MLVGKGGCENYRNFDKEKRVQILLDTASATTSLTDGTIYSTRSLAEINFFYSKRRLIAHQIRLEDVTKIT
jgi:hypothetical protein